MTSKKSIGIVALGLLVTLDGKSTNRVHTYSDRYRIPAKYQQVTE